MEDRNLIVFTIVVFIGGIYGLWRWNDLATFLKGTASAMALTFGIWYNRRRRIFYPLVIALITLMVVYIRRFMVNYKFLPNGLFAFICFILLCKVVAALQERVDRREARRLRIQQQQRWNQPNGIVPH